MAKSSSEQIAEQLAEHWRRRVVEQDAKILRLQNHAIELARACEYLLQRLQQAGIKPDETGDAR